MMTARDPVLPVTAACFFYARRLRPLLDAFAREIDGVKTAHDIEYIHRMRVASRRLRAALPLCASCFPEKDYRRWMQEIQKITRALGDARDADVQIAFLHKREKKRTSRPGPGGSNPPAESTGEHPVETLLLGRLKKKRAKLQDQVLSALARLEKGRVIEVIQADCDEKLYRQRHTRPHPLPYGIPPVAAARIGKRLDAFLSYEPWVHNPDAVAEHHAMRIAAKKLRYTLEVYSPLYRFGLKKYLSRVKRVQELLGEMHDRDVWIDMVTLMIMQERSGVRVHSVAQGRRGTPVTPLKQFLLERERERKALHRRFVFLWDSLSRARIWETLRSALDTGRRTKYRISSLPCDDLARASVSSLARIYPEGVSHADHVTGLALRMFDCLSSLHRLTWRERFLLECAGRLHDIGWKYGQQGHGARSAELVLSDETLPLDLADRAIIAVVVRAHRGKARTGYGGIMPVLSPADRNSALILAALLRIADGLDYLHEGPVQSVHCTLHADTVILAIDSVRDASTEKNRALVKADLFRQVLNRDIVIL